MEQDKFLRAFAKLDLNHDNRLSQKEIDEAVIDSSIDSGLAEIVAVLKANFQEIAELHKDGWFGRQNNISLADILTFEHILLQHSSDSKIDTVQSLHQERQKLTDSKTLAAIASGIMERVRDISGQKCCLYGKEGDPIESIKPDAIRQGMIGDCFFLAALNSVIATNPQIITRIIHDNHNDTYTVTFPGLRDEPITVETPTLVELALYARLTEWGTWPAVLEKAYGKYQAQFEKRPRIVAAENSSGAERMSDALQLLTGQMGRTVPLEKLNDDELGRILTDAFREKRAVGASSKPGKSGYTENANIPSNHAYSVVRWDPDLSMISLRNPWGVEKRITPDQVNSHAVDRIYDGFFTLDLPHFRLNFALLYYEEWMPDDEFIERFEAPPDSVIKNIDHPH